MYVNGDEYETWIFEVKDGEVTVTRKSHVTFTPATSSSAASSSASSS